MTQTEALYYLKHKPYGIGLRIGFTDLTELHNGWMKTMLTTENDHTLQAHRGSYKTTCVSIALSILMVAQPTKRIMFMRKTDDDVKEVIKQVQKILLSETMQIFSRAIWGHEIAFTVASATELSTNLSRDTKGTSQLVGMGLGSSLTGKHFDIIFTDDIVNPKDRISKAERDRTKLVYQELQNIKNRGGRIFNTGTPWHKDDCFTLMPEADKYDCYKTKLINEEQLHNIKSKMTASLFSANYELKHISDEDVIFSNPRLDADIYEVEQGIVHIDAAYGGEDYTAVTIARKKDGKFYIFGKLYHKHIEQVQDEIIKLKRMLNCGKIYCENNGDKGYLAKELRKLGERVSVYHEDMNKYLKITSYLKFAWEDVYFCKGTDEEYINQVCEYNENAEHDDAPDSLASIIRILSKKTEENYEPIYIMG